MTYEPQATLDHFVRCPVSGCDWHILYGTARCYLHKGPGGPQFRTDYEGAIIQTKFMTREQDPDFAPDDAA